MKSAFPIVSLGKHVQQISLRNKKDAEIEVFSVTNSEGFTRSTDYFSKEVFSKDVSNYKVVQRGQFAYNPSRINVGSIDYLRIAERALVSPLYIVFKTDPDLDSDYLLRYLKSGLGNSQIRANTEGAVRDSLKYKGLENIRIPLPKLNVQKRIANLLSKVDGLIAQRKQHLKELDELLKSIFLEMFGDPVRNEKGWQLRTIDSFSDSRLGKMRDKKFITGAHLRKYLGNSNVQWFRFILDDLLEMDFDEKERNTFKIEYGDLLVCEGGEIGRCAIWKNQIENCYFQKALHRVKLDRSKVMPEYLQYVFLFYSMFNGFKITSKATIAHLTGEKLKATSIPLPPVNLQNQFAAIVEKIESIKSRYHQSLTDLETLFGALSQKAFKGELDFSDFFIEEDQNYPIFVAPEKPKIDPLASKTSRLAHKASKNIENKEINQLIEKIEYPELLVQRRLDSVQKYSILDLRKLLQTKKGQTLDFEQIWKDLSAIKFEAQPIREIVQRDLIFLLEEKNPLVEQVYELYEEQHNGHKKETKKIVFKVRNED